MGAILSLTLYKLKMSGKSNDNSSCRLTDREDKINAYLVGELADSEIKDFEKHLFACDDCFQKLQFREQVVSLLQEEGDELFSKYLARRAQTESRAVTKKSLLDRVVASLKNFLDFSPIVPWRALTAGAMAVLGIMVVLNIYTGNQIDPANFAPLPYLETMVSDVHRAYSIEVFHPKNGENTTGQIKFEWENDITDVIYLKILNNKGDELFAFETQEQDFSFNQKLEPGLYYWKLESEDDLLHVGKFFFKKPEKLD